MNSKHYSGFIAELEVIQYYLRAGFHLKAHRSKIFKTEIDIIMANASKVILIEVKKTTHLDFLNYRMSLRQKERLQNAYLRVQSQSKVDVEFHYVIVSQSEGIEIFDDFLG